MHLPGNRLSAQVSLSLFSPTLCPGVAPRRARLQRRHAITSQARGSNEPLTLFSPSKINLFLRIMRRREDGFHDLASLFHVIDLGDSMTFSPIPGQADTLTCNVEDIPTDDSNLVLKALKLFRRHTSTQQFFQIHLDKKVPHGAGLGGGSGNAATTLWAANELAGRPASNQQLLQWSGGIGSDISVFFSEGAAYCTGRGEIVENVPPPLPLDTPLLLVKPPVGLSTPEIFKALDLSRRSTADPQQVLQQMSRRQCISQDLCINDLEQPAFDRLPELAQLKSRLQNDSDGRFAAVFMTGSGSTIVGVGSDQTPSWLQDEASQQHLFVSPARLIARQPGNWFQPTRSLTPLVAA